MAKLKHPHIYQRIRGTKDKYRCIHPDCTHFTDKSLLAGKRATCICGQEYYITPEMLYLRTPHCADCTKSNKTKKFAPEVNIDIQELFKAQNRHKKPIIDEEDFKW